MKRILGKLRCRRCGIGTLRLVSDFNGDYVIVHCQNPRCDVTYEECVASPQAARIEKERR